MSSFPVPPAVPDEPKGRNGLLLYARVLDEPGMVFKDIVQRPRIGAGLLVLVIVIFLRSFLMPDAILRQQVQIGLDAADKFRPGVITQDIRQQAMDQAATAWSRTKSAAFGSVGAIIGTAILAAILWGVFSLAGAELSYGNEYSILLYACAPTFVGMLVQLALAPVTQSATFSLGLGFMVSADTSPFLHVFLASVTLFSVWTLYLLALGHQTLKKEKSISGALTIIVVLWLCVTLLTSYFGARFGGAAMV